MFAELEQDLVETLEAALKNDGVQVLTAAELADVTTDRQPIPAVHLVYQGYSVSEVRPDGRAARIQQNWLTVAACRNLRTMRSGKASRNEAAMLAKKVLDAFMGYRSGNAVAPAKIANAPKPAYVDGITYFPIAFSIETAFSKGANT